MAPASWVGAGFRIGVHSRALVGFRHGIPALLKFEMSVGIPAIGPELVNDSDESGSANDQNSQKNQCRDSSTVQKVANHEKPGPGHRATSYPAQQSHRYVFMRCPGFGFTNPSLHPYAPPPGTERPHFSIKRHQDL